MKHPTFDDKWPESWKSSYQFDLNEVYGQSTSLGYSYAYQNRRKIALELIVDVVPSEATILDIAAAQGNFSLLLAELGYKVCWNDYREELAGYVQLKHERGVVVYAPGNAFEVKFPSLFDAVLITEVIEHVAHPDEFLYRVAQLVRPGGYIVMTTPNGAYFRNRLPKFSDCEDPSAFESIQFGPDAGDHIFLLHEDEIREFARATGLEIESMRLFTNPLTNGHVKLGTLLPFLPRSVVEFLEQRSQELPWAIKSRLLAQLGVRFRRPI